MKLGETFTARTQGAVDRLDRGAVEQARRSLAQEPWKKVPLRGEAGAYLSHASRQPTPNVQGGY